MNNWCKRHLVDTLLPCRSHFSLRQHRFRPYAFPPPPEVNSTNFNMGNLMSGPQRCMPEDSVLELLKGWVCALREQRDSRDLTVVTRDYVESVHLLDRQRVHDSRKVTLKAARETTPFWKKAREKTAEYDKRCGEIDVELKRFEESIYQQRKSAEEGHDSRKVTLKAARETTPFWKKVHEKTAEYDKRFGEIDVELKRFEESIYQQRKPAEDLSDLFVPLTVEEENVVHDCLYSTDSSSEVLVLHESSNIEITRAKFRCLRPGGWLNDEVINLYLELLKEREVREPKRFLKCHFFNTFFYKKLACGKDGCDYKSVKRWTTRRKLGYELIHCDKIFVPVHKNIHWCLAIINMKEKTLQYLDSFGGMDHNVLQRLAVYITEELKDKSNTEVNTSSWRKESVDSIPLQKNGSDCGMFMLKYIDFHSRGLSLSFSQENMEYFRKRVANEIFRLRAD